MTEQNFQTTNQDIFLSVVVPVFNEAVSISDLFREILAVGNKIGRPFEIIFVNDGSTDDTLSNLKKLKPLKIINFRKNFGQTAALDAGIKLARGRFIATLDGDGQNDPADIVGLLKKIESEDFDAVSGWRRLRFDNLLKRFSSKLAAAVRSLLIDDGIHDSGCTLKIYRRECFTDIDLMGEMHRFIPAILKIAGFKIGEMEVHHRPRLAGRTKYNWKRGVKGGLDMIAVWFWKKYVNRPLHLFGLVGLVMMTVSTLIGFSVAYLKIFLHKDLSDNVLTTLSLFGFVISCQFLIFGLMSDIMSKIYFSRGKSRPYYIKEVIDHK